MTVLKWYALRSKIHKEDFVWRRAEAQGFETFYPRIHVRPVNPRARKVIPYFPSYLFVRANLDDVGVSAFDRMPDAIGLVSFGGEPVSVEDGLIAAIQHKLESLPAPSFDPVDLLKPGDPVIIENGPFAGYKALFDARLPGRERVRVLLQMLNHRAVGVELAPAQIKAANPS